MRVSYSDRIKNTHTTEQEEYEGKSFFHKVYLMISPGSVPVLLGIDRPGYIVVFAPNLT